MGRRKPQRAQRVVALGASLIDESPIPLIPFAARSTVSLNGARIARPAEINYGPELEEEI